MKEITDIDKLNEEVKLRVAPSSIHGVGVVALRDLQMGEKLYADRLPVIYKTKYARLKSWCRPEVFALLIERWPNIVNGSNFMYPDTNMQAYMNHADEPNYDAKSDLLLTDVKQGEEITENYRAIEGYQQVFPWLV